MALPEATFFVDMAKDNPVLYALLVVITMTVVALVMHWALEKLIKVLKR